MAEHLRAVRRGLRGTTSPRFRRDLGFYDLRSLTLFSSQIAMAAQAGLRGFAFYYYTFDGERVLDLPSEVFMELEHDFGFFLIWANENWTRTMGRPRS